MMLLLGLLLMLLSFIFLGLGFNSGANAFGLAIAVAIFFWAPTAFLFFFAVVFFLASTMKDSNAEYGKPTELQPTSLPSVSAFFCKKCGIETLPNASECVWCGQSVDQPTGENTCFF